jgi:hypothetical protein
MSGSGKLTYRGFAKPDDPIYKEGWSIHIGPLLGSEPAQSPNPAQATLGETVKKSNAATVPVTKAKRRRKQ